MKNNPGFFLAMLAFGLFCSFATAIPAFGAPHAACATPDFMEFIKKYSELSVQDQASCARFPLKANGVRYVSQQELLASDNFKKQPIISSRKRLSKNPKIKLPKELFMQLSADGSAVNVKPEEIVYVAQKKGDTVLLSLTSGGTFTFYQVTFTWRNNSWWVLEIYEPSEE